MTTSKSRRAFLKGLLGATATAAASTLEAAPLHYLKPTVVENPLASYPNREWESVYRNIFKTDSSFTFLCAPNDTHNCLLGPRQERDVVWCASGPPTATARPRTSTATKASHRWDPRICQKGLALVRRIYGDRRVKSPMVRGLQGVGRRRVPPRPEETGKPDPKYFQRGKDKWLRRHLGRGVRTPPRRWTTSRAPTPGEPARNSAHAQGYDEAMVEATDGSGMQTIKLRGGMAFLGATRIYGLYRFANMMALADAKIRGVAREVRIGARGWDSYSWHTDLPPGHPMVTGAQTNDFELFAVEHPSSLFVWGMNWITTKMPDSHWMTEARLKGTKVVAITVEYSATASKADEVVVIRPGTDPAFALGSPSSSSLEEAL
jgi:nitrate reductase alpha subunit